tara:strand:- start:42369 stop:42935 length:567 start_codon:yes stop_codon:yes gene_type:complete
MSNLYLALVHHPIKNKNNELVTTSVTNLDIHDISRSCRTFNIKNYYIVTPLEAQHKLVNRILGHWDGDASNSYNPDRSDALSIAKVINSIEETCNEIEKNEGVAPKIVATGANFESFNKTTKELSEQMKVDNVPYLLIFGTGWGLHASLLERADIMLEPIFGNSNDGYNHLSVRSAVAIYLDRIARCL